MSVEGGELRGLSERLLTIIDLIKPGHIMTKGKADRAERILIEAREMLNKAAKKFDNQASWHNKFLEELHYVLPEGQYPENDRSVAYDVIREYLHESREPRIYDHIDATTWTKFSILFDGPLARTDPVTIRWDHGLKVMDYRNSWLGNNHQLDLYRYLTQMPNLTPVNSSTVLQGKRANLAIIDDLVKDPIKAFPFTLKGFPP